MENLTEVQKKYLSAIIEPLYLDKTKEIESISELNSEGVDKELISITLDKLISKKDRSVLLHPIAAFLYYKFDLDSKYSYFAFVPPSIPSSNAMKFKANTELYFTRSKVMQSLVTSEDY